MKTRSPFKSSLKTKRPTADKMVVANTILEQLGGNRFRAMTGAKNFVGGESQLTFSIPRARDSLSKRYINKVAITLDHGHDTYDMKFYNIRGANVEEVRSFEGVYNDQLQEIFTSVTGLYASL